METFQKLKKVVTMCFKIKLYVNYKKYIEESENSLGKLRISGTPKILTVFFHKTDFCCNKQYSLGFYSKQAARISVS